MPNLDKELEVAISIAREAGTIMLKYFDGNQEIEIKEDNSQVTIADKTINSLVIERLSKEFPDDGVIGEEESTAEYGMGRKWFCDPIDGTAAYVWGVPTAMFSLALVIDGRPALGVAYDPFLNKLYTAKAGEKSFCNDKELAVSKLDLHSGIFAVSGAIKSVFRSHYFQKMADDKIRIAAFSGAVYKCCLIAAGRLVGYLDNANAHDVAAAELILKGAGGKITSMDGKDLDYSKPFKGVIASNGVTHEEIIKYCS